MRTWSFYDQETGDISGKRFRAINDRVLAANTPTGFTAIEGAFDRLSQRVDVETGKVIDYQPPAPDDDHEWNATRRRWVKKPEVLAAERRDKAARDRIAELEASQLRATREHLLDPIDPAPTARLRAIDDEIKTLRSDLIQVRA